MAGVYDSCARCGAALVHASGRGMARKYCGPDCQSEADALRWAARKYSPCSVEGCQADAKRVGAGLCEAHYMRKHRHGSTEMLSRVKPGPLLTTHGYVLVEAPSHPRALGSYRAYEHRKVFQDAHGDGPFNCHWCGVLVSWDGDMEIDHVDSDKTNNSLSNLVASCPPCNQARGQKKMREGVNQRHGIVARGERRTMAEWADYVGISRATIARRLSLGWDIDRAIFTPRGKCGPTRRRFERRDSAALARSSSISPADGLVALLVCRVGHSGAGRV